MVVKIVKQMLLFSLSVSVALAEYSVSAEYTAKTFRRSHFRSDTSDWVNFRALARGRRKTAVPITNNGKVQSGQNKSLFIFWYLTLKNINSLPLY
jgi:hypothetical protein